MSSVNYIDWLENEKNVKHHKYSDFKNVQQIGNGAFGRVYRADWKNTTFALKSFRDNNEQTLKNIVKELTLHRDVDFHENILRFHGITIKTDYSDATHQRKEYSLVLEYADSDTLKTYLNKHFNELEWDDKFSLALQLSNAILCLHECDIIHRDLHAGNILVHQKKIKLADFGLSKKLAEDTSITLNNFGVIPYMDPRSFNNKNNTNNQNEHYKLNKKSDVYSIGVIMWLISSGRRPFYPEGENYDVGLALDIKTGKREEIIDGTPIEYSKLYTKCWNDDPDERPDVQEVVLQLETMSFKRSGILITNEENACATNDSSKEISNMNSELLIDNILQIVESKNTWNLQTYDTNAISDLSRISDKESTVSLTSIFTVNQTVIDKLIKSIIKKHNQGIALVQIQQLINQQMSLNQDKDKLVKWLLKNQNEAQYIWLLGLFYYYDTNTEDNSSRAFQLFSKASEGNFPLAQVYLAKCYSEGYGTMQDANLAFEWYNKSVDNNSIIGQFYLGCCYEYGIGIEKDEEKAVYWYKKATKNDNITAKLYLANCYKLGKGVEKDENKAFKYYKILANQQKDADAQQQLGNCYYYGIGTNIDRDYAIYWYKKATQSGNIIAKDILKEKEIKIPITERFSQLGLYYIGKLLIRIRYEKAFHYFEEAAEYGNKIAQHNLGYCYRDGIGVVKNERKAFELFKKSAEQGYTDGQFRFGHCYDKGIGVNIDKVKALELYKIAAKKGSLEAQNNLGYLYEKGEGTEKNLQEAINWYKKAANNGNKLSQYNLGICYENEIGVEKDELKAFEYYKKSAKYKRPYALNLFYENGISVGNDIIKAFESYKKLAKQKYQDAQYKVAYFYDKGIGTKVNKKAAIKLYRKVAKKGNEIAQTRLGVLYEREKKLKEAIYWYNEASENEVALFNLGRCYQYGIGVEKNENKAFEHYKKSAEHGYIGGKFELGNCYNKGIGTEINKVKAFELYKEAVEQGSIDGIYQLGNCYDKGIGTEVNKKKAFELYIKIAEKNKFAQNNLGVFYEKGEGTTKDLVKAILWYNKAAENGNEAAQYNLGVCYKLGVGVKKNEDKAFEYYKKSTAQGDIDGKYQLGNCYDKGIGTEINKEKAIELYKEAAEKENKFAQHSLGILYENGKGIEINLEKAIYWYNKAAENRNEVALYDLGRCYEQGIGVEKDDVKAFEFYKKSHEFGHQIAQYKIADYNHRGLESHGENVDKEYEFI